MKEWLKYGTSILWNTIGIVFKKNEAINVLIRMSVCNIVTDHWDKEEGGRSLSLHRMIPFYF